MAQIGSRFFERDWRASEANFGLVFLDKKGLFWDSTWHVIWLP